MDLLVSPQSAYHDGIDSSRVWRPVLAVGDGDRRPTSRCLEAALPWDGLLSPSAHLVGVCGSGMQALAELLTGLGWRVSGSDRQVADDVAELLGCRGLRILQGHAASHLPADADVLVHSQAIGPENVERVEATGLGIPQLSYSQMLGRLMSDRVGVSIAGTHGKSTTTAMMASLLDTAGLSPSAVVGARLVGRESSGWAGIGDLMVVESCEYRRSFLDLAPRYAVITGIEPDHFDCYASLGEMTEAFGEFAASIAKSGLLLARADCPAPSAAAGRALARAPSALLRRRALSSAIRSSAALCCGFRSFACRSLSQEVLARLSARSSFSSRAAFAAALSWACWGGGGSFGGCLVGLASAVVAVPPCFLGRVPVATPTFAVAGGLESLLVT